MLEIASGTGEHAVFFAAAFPGLIWQPTDHSPDALGSIAAHRDVAGAGGVEPPIHLDAAAPEWPVAHTDAVVAINMVHIAPWTATEGLMRGAGRLLPEGSPLCLYGPFLEDDVATAPSNLAFDGDLRARNPGWGLRRLEEVAATAERHGLGLASRTPMPANNLFVVFRRNSGQRGRVEVP